MCPTFDKNFVFIFVVTSYLDQKIQYHENRTFLFCLSIHVVDNFNVKASLICNESLFQRTDKVKNQIHYDIVLRQGSFPPRELFYIKQIRHIKRISYACKFVLDKYFVMQFRQTLDMTSN